ncbi:MULTISPECIES: major capsid protein [Methylomicrobium]|uniref:major capsid protein n=1 Tax=Methylomicrobium TaxID=39773 RepID=UPI0002623FD8|nr:MULTISPECIES: major capsid protein [Methylomicrobium]
MKTTSKVALGAGLTGVANLAAAAVPAGVSTALGDAAADAATIGGLALVAVVAAVAFQYMRRAL